MGLDNIASPSVSSASLFLLASNSSEVWTEAVNLALALGKVFALGESYIIPIFRNLFNLICLFAYSADAVHLFGRVERGPLLDLCSWFNWEPPLFPTALAIRPGENLHTVAKIRRQIIRTDPLPFLLLIRHATVSGSNITSTTCLSYLQHGKFGVRVCVKLDNGPTHPYIMPRMFIKILRGPSEIPPSGLVTNNKLFLLDKLFKAISNYRK